jgi:hypothetical protein
MRLACIALFAAAACGPNLDFRPVPHQGQATALIWAGYYGDTVSPPPTAWFHQPQLNCYVGAGGNFIGFYRGDNGLFSTPVRDAEHCVAGVTWQPDYVVEVAYDTDFTFASGAWPHEMWHATLFNRTGDGDPQHLDPGFAPGGAVDQARNILKENGL